MPQTCYVIKNVRDGDPDENLFWSNEEGWTELPEATVFTEGERRSLTPPISGKWEKLPSHPDVLIHVVTSEQSEMKLPLTEEDVLYTLEFARLGMFKPGVRRTIGEEMDTSDNYLLALARKITNFMEEK